MLDDLAAKLEQPAARLEVSNAEFVRASLAAHDIAVRSLQAIVEMPADISSRFASPVAMQQTSVGLVRLPLTPYLLAFSTCGQMLVNKFADPKPRIL